MSDGIELYILTLALAQENNFCASYFTVMHNLSRVLLYKVENSDFISYTFKVRPDIYVPICWYEARYD